MIRLASGYRLRHPTEADLPTAQSVLDAAESADCGEPRRHEGDLVVVARDPRLDLPGNAWLVESPGGDVAAFGWIWAPDSGDLSGDLYVHPDHVEVGLDDGLLDVVERRAAELASAAPGRHPSLAVAIEDIHAARRASVMRRGFSKTREYYSMRVDDPLCLGGSSPPQGIELRLLRAGIDERAVYEAHEEAFVEHHMFDRNTFEQWRLHHLEVGNADLGLWLLAWDGDELAGFVTAIMTEDDGMIADLAVQAPWRGRGVGSALLCGDMALLAARGARVVRLMVDA